jgi:hypothetical protein
MADSTLRGLTVRDNRFGGIGLGSGLPLNNDNRIVDNDVYGNGCREDIKVTQANGNRSPAIASTATWGPDLLWDGNVVRDNVAAHSGAGIEPVAATSTPSSSTTRSSTMPTTASSCSSVRRARQS